MLLDVPFLPDTRYVPFLQEHEQSLYSVHYSLEQEYIPDGRHKTATRNIAELNHALSKLKNVKKYALLNSRFHTPQTYLDPEARKRILTNMEILLAEGNIDGITVVDIYLVQALSDASPQITNELEASLGINCMLDDFDRIRAFLNIIATTNFKSPSKLNLDRSLNRNMKQLKDISYRCREYYPGIRLTLMTNEGCLFRCPYKLAHDAHISIANFGMCGNMTFEVNRELGCIRLLSDHPEEILKSPFIRPEDQNHYIPYADVLKICGRTLGPDFLQNTISAYITGRYKGNLLALLDTQDWQVDRLTIANDSLPTDFVNQLTTCDKDCERCDYCSTLFKQVSRYNPFVLKDFRGP